MAEPERGDQHQSGSKKHSIDDIIDHMTADLQSYEGQYILLGSPPNSQHVWSEYTAPSGQPMTVHNPVFVQQPYEMHDRKIQDFSPQHGLFYPNPPRVHERSGEMIGMVDVGGGNFVNVVFNPTNPGPALHSYIPAHHPDPNMGYIHYPQQQSQPAHNSPVHRDYGLFHSGNESVVNQNNHQLIENVVGNWLPNKSGTYSPFGGVPPTQTEILDDDSRTVRPGQVGQLKKPRIVAEVRPMRPSYSDVLAKSVPPLTPPLAATKSSHIPGSVTKNEGKKQNIKGLKAG